MMSFNILTSLLLAWESRRSGSKETNPGYVIFWTALYALGSSLCMMVVIVLFLLSPAPGYYRILSAAAIFFWIGQKLWNVLFNIFLVQKFVTCKATIQPMHQAVHVVVIALSILLTGLVLRQPSNGISFSYTGRLDGGYYEIHVTQRAYGFLIPLAEILSLAIAVGIMALMVFKNHRAAEDQEMISQARDAMLCKRKELERALKFYLLHPLLVGIFCLAPGLIVALQEDHRIPDDPSTWFRTFLAISLYGGEGWAISLYRLCQLWQIGRRRATNFPPIQAAIDDFHWESIGWALHGYLENEGRREPNCKRAEEVCMPEDYSQPLADFHIIEPWKFQQLREEWVFGFEHQYPYRWEDLPQQPSGEKITVTLQNMEVTIQPGDALVDYLNSIMCTKTLHNRHRRLGYYHFMKDHNTMLSKIYGAFKIRLHTGPCYSVILKEKFHDYEVGVP